MDGRKFFISYRRNVENDRRLAHYLKAGLEASGYKAFIDVDISVGTKWADKIDQEIISSDHFVVLLSEQSIASEMVQAEVRKAHHAKRSDGRPIILPVRVAYRGPLDYELDSYLSPLQYLDWNGDDDSESVLNKLAGAARPQGLHDDPKPFGHRTAEPSTEHSKPVTDRLALLRAPGGPTRIGDPFYIERMPDGIVEAASGGVGETIVIKAPRQMGKSSLLARYLERCSDAGKSIVDLKFQIFTDAELDDYLTLLQRLAEETQRSLALGGPEVGPFKRQIDFVHFLEDHVLKQVAGPVTFAFDGVDRILGQPYQGDFFCMLRAWHNKRANIRSPWAEVDLALVIATEPYLLIKSADQSPFNVAVPIALVCLEKSMVADLNNRYHHPLEMDELSLLFDLLAGHPHLTRLAFFRLKGEGMTFGELMARAFHNDGPFGDHLRAMLLLLQRQPTLLAAFKRLIREDGWQPDEETYYRLHGAGLACRRHGRIEPANTLYSGFFTHVQ